MAEETKIKPSWIDQNWKAITLIILFVAGWTNLRLAVKELQVQMKMVLTQISINKTAERKEKVFNETRQPVSNSVSNHSSD